MDETPGQRSLPLDVVGQGAEVPYPLAQLVGGQKLVVEHGLGGLHEVFELLLPLVAEHEVDNVLDSRVGLHKVGEHSRYFRRQLIEGLTNPGPYLCAPQGTGYVAAELVPALLVDELGALDDFELRLRELRESRLVFGPPDMDTGPGDEVSHLVILGVHLLVCFQHLPSPAPDLFARGDHRLGVVAHLRQPFRLVVEGADELDEVLVVLALRLERHLDKTLCVPCRGARGYLRGLLRREEIALQGLSHSQAGERRFPLVTESERDRLPFFRRQLRHAGDEPCPDAALLQVLGYP